MVGCINHSLRFGWVGLDAGGFADVEPTWTALQRLTVDTTHDGLVPIEPLQVGFGELGQTDETFAVVSGELSRPQQA